jgi:hypothetical protein
MHKNIGLFVSCDLGWSHYINSITRAAYKKLGILKGIVSKLTKKKIACAEMKHYN